MDGDPQQWVPYSQRPEWSDIVPAPVTDDDGAVVAIQYSKQHKELLAYFRAVAEQGERSERVLQLTAELIESNSADYTAWQYRWETLMELQADLTQEYQFTLRVAEESAKNYQLWNHRRKLASRLGPSTAELELQFCAEALAADAKNYHAWAHRQAVVAAAGAWQRELEYVDGLLQQDHTLDQYNSLLELLDAEVEYAAAQICRAPDNESAWNYLWGLFSLPGCSSWEMGRHSKVFIICQEALADQPSCKPALDTLSQYYHHLAMAAIQQQAYSQAQEAASYGLAVLEKAAVADPIKGMYWRRRREQLQQLMATASVQT
eukprot:gene3675-3936_t